MVAPPDQKIWGLFILLAVHILALVEPAKICISFAYGHLYVALVKHGDNGEIN